LPGRRHENASATIDGFTTNVALPALIVVHVRLLISI
jgi:hypothetical protein